MRNDLTCSHLRNLKTHLLPNTPPTTMVKQRKALAHNIHISKQFIQHDKEDGYIKLTRMVFLPLELNKVKVDAFLDSGAYIISESDAEKIENEADQCTINELSHPSFKVQYANNQLQQTLDTSRCISRLHPRNDIKCSYL